MIQLALIDSRLDELYPTFEAWWKGHEWPPVPIVALRTMGLMASEGDKPVAACWVYTASEGGFAMLEWMVTDPRAKPMASARAVNALIAFAKEECRQRGYKVLFTTCRQQSLGRMYHKNGFQKTDEQVTHFIAVL